MRRRLATVMVATAVSWCATASFAATGVDAASSGAFAGTAAASGVRVTVEVPNAPATNTPVDGGGPTAQASLSSVGESTGYAAFPDPGGLVISAPGLIAGLSQAPVSPPEYPLFVSSDATNRPVASVDAGAYSLRANSDATSSRGAATAGLSSDPAGNAGKVSSVATVTSTEGRVVSVGTTEVTGLMIGPLAIGAVRSTAQLVQNPDGSRTPTSNLELNAVEVAGNPIQVTTDGLNLANGASVPLPIGATANELLQAQGITVEVLGVSATEGTVVSPALRIRFPSSIPNAGTAIVTIVVGSSIASLTSILGDPASTAAPGAVIEPGSALPATDSIGADPVLPGTVGDFSGAVAPVSADQTQTGLRIPAQLAIDISSFYLVCALAIAVVFVMSQLIRLVGVRARWRS